MREIKFRAKRVDNGKWVYGGVIVCDDYCIIDQGHEVYVEEECEHDGDTHYFGVAGVMCDENSIGQFTGLHDKNGKEIYEGDILRSLQPNKLMVVVYDEIGASFVVAVINKNSARKLGVQFHISKSWLKKYPKEVIGNIVDNPELINKEE